MQFWHQVLHISECSSEKNFESKSGKSLWLEMRYICSMKWLQKTSFIWAHHEISETCHSIHFISWKTNFLILAGRAFYQIWLGRFESEFYRVWKGVCRQLNCTSDWSSMGRFLIPFGENIYKFWNPMDVQSSVHFHHLWPWHVDENRENQYRILTKHLCNLDMRHCRWQWEMLPLFVDQIYISCPDSQPFTWDMLLGYIWYFHINFIGLYNCILHWHLDFLWHLELIWSVFLLH